MIEGIMKGLFQWLYGLFLDLVSYCANALLGVMSTDLSFFEESVPVVPSLYSVFVAVGWGLLIGNCVFQAMKAMFAGMGFETDSPAILLLRTFLFGFLLIFSKSICEIGLSIGKKVIDLLGIPSKVELSFPDEGYFSGGASWLLVIIIGFILGFQLIKLFFEIAERYVLVGILTLLCPVGLAMGGSKATKDICAGYIRVFASMVILMVSNVLFLKLVLSALSTMPSGTMVLPWCLLVVGLAKTARKADNLLSRIGLNPSNTGDPLGSGRGMMMAAMAARTIINTASKNSRTGKAGSSAGNRGTSASSRTSAPGRNAKPTGPGRANSTGYYSSYTSGTSNAADHASNHTTVSGGNQQSTANIAGAQTRQKASRFETSSGGFYRSSSSSRYTGGSVSNAGAAYSTVNRQDATSRNSQTGIYRPAAPSGGHGLTDGGTRINSDRFGIQKSGTVITSEVGVKGSPVRQAPTSGSRKGKAVGTPATVSRGNAGHQAPTPKIQKNGAVATSEVGAKGSAVRQTPISERQKNKTVGTHTTALGGNAGYGAKSSGIQKNKPSGSSRSGQFRKTRFGADIAGFRQPPSRVRGQNTSDKVGKIPLFGKPSKPVRFGKEEEPDTSIQEPVIEKENDNG